MSRNTQFKNVLIYMHRCRQTDFACLTVYRHMCIYTYKPHYRHIYLYAHNIYAWMQSYIHTWLPTSIYDFRISGFSDFHISENCIFPEIGKLWKMEIHSFITLQLCIS